MSGIVDINGKPIARKTTEEDKNKPHVRVDILFEDGYPVDNKVKNIATKVAEVILQSLMMLGVRHCVISVKDGYPEDLLVQQKDVVMSIGFLPKSEEVNIDIEIPNAEPEAE